MLKLYNMNLPVKLFLFLSLLLGCTYSVIAQDSVYISGDNIEDAYVNSINYEPNGYSQSLIAAKWTYDGNEGKGRSFIKFDLSEIPCYSKIISARLSLYHDPTSDHIGHSDLGGDNSGIIMRAVEDWTDNEITWYTQPVTTNTNWVILPAPESDDQDYPDIDVTKLVQDMVNHPDIQQGFIIKLLDEYELYRSLVFASVDHSDTNIRPKLFVKYDRIQYTSVISIKPDGEEGKDAYINSVLDTPHGDQTTLIATVWTYNGEEGTGRFLIDFPLSQDIIPEGMIILRAELNLYYDPVSDHIGHSTLGGKNDLIIRRITEPWDEHTVTWYNQPGTSADVDQVIVNSSNLENQHYLNIDVTGLVNTMINNPDEEYGLLIKLLEEESVYRSVVFASSDHPDSLLWPSLDIYCGLMTQDNNIQSDDIDFFIYPNPNPGRFTLRLTGQILTEELTMFIFNDKGWLIKNTEIKSNTSLINLTDTPAGIYYVRIGSKVKKICVIH